MQKTWIEEQLEKDPGLAARLEEETLIVAAVEELHRAMQVRGMTKADLARALGKSEPWIAKVMKGENLTLRTLARLAGAVGMHVDLVFRPVTSERLGRLEATAAKQYRQQRGDGGDLVHDRDAGGGELTVQDRRGRVGRDARTGAVKEYAPLKRSSVAPRKK